MTAIDAHQVGRTRNVTASFVEFALDEFPMIGIAGFFEGRKTIRRGWRLFITESRQVFYRDAQILMHDHYALNGISQLAHIARPRISLHGLDCFRVELLRLFTVAFGEPLIEMLNQ